MTVEDGERISFEYMGAPWVDGKKLERELSQKQLPGVEFEQQKHTPQSQKNVGIECDGRN